ncbi:MAG: hypothetical protein LBH48_06565, partial [Bifidobacteriaceae bacterium]|nr:hypothetical protein [Bifidobacteriaceae bacterium]
AASGIEPPTQRTRYNTNTQPLNATSGRETARATGSAHNGMETRRRSGVLGSCGGDLMGGAGGFVLSEQVSVGVGRPEVLKTGDLQVGGEVDGALGVAIGGRETGTTGSAHNG